jgi:hypothetical protein
MLREQLVKHTDQPRPEPLQLVHHPTPGVVGRHAANKHTGVESRQIDYAHVAAGKANWSAQT